MAFTTLLSKNSVPSWRGVCRLLPALLLGLACSVQAGEFPISEIHTKLKDGVYLLDADIDYAFSDEALLAMSNGVPLTIQLTIAIERVRNWWPDEEIANLEQRYTLQYHALSHQYLLRNLNSGAFYSYPRFETAVQVLGRIRNLPLLDSKLVLPEEDYEIAMRAELDIESLPSPLRIVAYISPDWRLNSDWYRWSLTP